jgi:hypothetical protein
MQHDVGQLIEDGELCAAMGQRAQAFAQSQFTADANGAEIEQFLLEICAQ